MCFDQPISIPPSQISLLGIPPSQISSYVILGDKLCHFKTKSDLQDVFNKLRNKKYSWAMFIVKTELDELTKDKGISTLLREKNDEDESLDAQFKVPLAPKPEVEWFNLAKKNEFTLPDLNN